MLVVFLQQLHSARQEGVLCDLRRRCGENGTCVLGLKGGGVHVSVLAETAAGATPQGPTWIIKVVAGLAETIRDFRVSPDGGIVGTLRAE
jgi:hypothetical protein